LGTDLNLENLIESYDAVLLSIGDLQVESEYHLGQVLGESWQSQLNSEKNQIASHPKIFASQASTANETVVGGAALGRRIAVTIYTWLNRH
jgi:hypothetical protein